MSTVSETAATEAMAYNSIEYIQTALKTLTTSDLFKLIKLATAEAEKQTKTAEKALAKQEKALAKQEKTTKKKSTSGQAGGPPQLKKPRAWVEYTLTDAIANGWEAFTVRSTHTDKTTGEKIIEEIEMPASVLYDTPEVIAHIFEGSVSEAHPTGKQLKHKDAMSLSKQRKETGHPTYAAFEAQYIDMPAATGAGDSSETDASSTSKASSTRRLTAAEKEALAEQKREAKKAAKELEKEEKRREKEELKTTILKQLEEKAAKKKAAKEAEKAAKEEAKKETHSVPIKPQRRHAQL
jgi:hypothetical protein